MLEQLRPEDLQDWLENPCTRILHAMCFENEKFYNVSRFQCLIPGEAHRTQELRHQFLGQAASFNQVRAAIESKDFSALNIPQPMENEDNEEPLGDLSTGRPGTH